MPSIVWFSILVPCKPNALPLARQGLSVGCAYPKSCTLPLARQAHHRPLNTCPHRLIHGTSAVCVGRSVYGAVRHAPSISTPSTLHPPQSRSDFKKSGSQSAPPKPKLAFRFVVTHWRVYRTADFNNRLHIPLDRQGGKPPSDAGRTGGLPCDTRENFPCRTL